MRRGEGLDLKQWKHFGEVDGAGFHFFPFKFSVGAEDWWWKVWLKTAYFSTNFTCNWKCRWFHELCSDKYGKKAAWTQSGDKVTALADTQAASMIDVRLAQALFIHLLVALEDGWSDKGLLAQVTLVLLMAVVHHLDVDVERVLSLEGAVALVALECPLTCSKDRGTLVRAISSYLLLCL